MKVGKYPRIGASRLAKKGLCACCNAIAEKRMDVQVSYMRGDDEVFLLCGRHLELINSGNFDAIFSAAEATRNARRKPVRSGESEIYHDRRAELVGKS